MDKVSVSVSPWRNSRIEKECDAECVDGGVNGCGGIRVSRLR